MKICKFSETARDWAEMANYDLVKLSGYGWNEYKGFDKTAIRASLSGVLEIVEVK